MNSEDFKSFCRALIPSEVGSIPTRSRQSDRRRPRSGRGAVPLACLVILTAMAASPILAQGLGPGDAVGGGRSSAERPLSAPVDSTARVMTPRAAGAGPFRPSPMGALLRSALVPGWGQLYNRRPIKAALFAVGRVYLGYRAVDEHRLARDLEDEAEAITDDPAARDRKWRERNRALDRRDDFIWWSVFALAFTFAEAYVDAALMDFGDEFKGVGTLPEDDARLRIGYEVRF